MWEDNSHLQPHATAQLVGLQSLVMFLEKVSTSRSARCCKKDSNAGLRKQQISNVFANQEALRVTNISPLTAIDTFSGARNRKINADFYDDCQNIPDPSALDHMQKNLLLLGDCFLGKQNKAEAYYTRGRPSTPAYSSKKFKLYYPVPTRCKESSTYPR